MESMLNSVDRIFIYGLCVLLQCALASWAFPRRVQIDDKKKRFLFDLQVFGYFLGIYFFTCFLFYIFCYR